MSVKAKMQQLLYFWPYPVLAIIIFSAAMMSYIGIHISLFYCYYFFMDYLVSSVNPQPNT